MKGRRPGRLRYRRPREGKKKRKENVKWQSGEKRRKGNNSNKTRAKGRDEKHLRKARAVKRASPTNRPSERAARENSNFFRRRRVIATHYQKAVTRRPGHRAAEINRRKDVLAISPSVDGEPRRSRGRAGEGEGRAKCYRQGKDFALN